MNKAARFTCCFLAAAMMMSGFSLFAGSDFTPADGISTVYAAEASVKVQSSAGFGEGMYATWTSVTGATGYNVYVDGNQIDSMLIRQYTGYMRADAPGLKAGEHTMKIVPIINGKEDSSKAAEAKATAYAHDRSGFGFVNGTSSGAYNEDGTLKSDAVVIYVTEATKDSVTASIDISGKGAETVTGVQNIITGYKKGKEKRPLCVRVIGNITDPADMPKGDLMVDTVKAGLTIEGIGNDAVFNGFGLVMKNSSNVEVRNIGFMNCNSSEGDNCGLQQANDHIWVHNCDFFYGDAGSDADQAKGDGALDTKKSTFVTHSYNHFWDNGKCNLQGMKSETTENYITYHHNWYDHSDSRHPRIRTCSVHIYNNYFDGNAKYGVGVTMGASAFVENNYFRACKNPMMSSGQGTDALGEGTFSGETGGVIKAYNNIIKDAASFITYEENNTSFDAYEVSAAKDAVPSSVKALSGGTSYNNFDTSSVMYSYTADKPEDVPSVVTAKAGRVDGGDFKWQFNNAVDDESYAVNTELKAALTSYKGSVVAIGSGFKEDNSAPPAVTTPAPSVTTTVSSVTAPQQTTQASSATQPIVTNAPVSGENVIYCSPTGTGDGKSINSPTGVLSAIKAVPAGGMIYLLEGTYSFTETIIIDKDNSGKQGAYKTIAAYPGANVKFDFTGQATAPSNRGFVLAGSYWHFYGFEITKAGDNGMLLAGNNNRIEMMVFNDNQDTGLQISRFDTSAATIDAWPSNNLILNCTSKNNCDDATMENADGFAAKLTCGPGNVFDGCMAYNNSDDGWDLYAKTETGPIGIVTIKNSIAFRNGFTEFGEGYGDCDGNGFKLGGSGVGSPHVVENCLAFENLHCGFTDNNNPKLDKLTNCTSFNNNMEGKGKPNFSLYRCTDDGCDFKNMMSVYDASVALSDSKLNASASNDKFVGTYENGVYYNSGYYQVDAKTDVTNGAKIGTKLSAGPAASDFQKYGKAPEQGADFHKIWRNADGSIWTEGLYQTASGSKYASMGAHFVKSTNPATPPAVEPSDPITTTVTQAPPVTTTTTVASNVTTTTVKDEVSFKYGDLNDNGVVDVTDLSILAIHLADKIPFDTEAQKLAADVSGDGAVNLADLAHLRQYISRVTNWLGVKK